MDKKELKVIRGCVEHIERIPYEFTPKKPSFGAFAEMFAPIFLALIGNGNLAVSFAVTQQNRYIVGSEESFLSEPQHQRFLIVPPP